MSSNFKLDERNEEQLLEFIWKLAGQLPMSEEGPNWQSYLAKSEGETEWESVKERLFPEKPNGCQAPDIALLHIAAKFYKEYLQDTLNKLPQELNTIYYEQMRGFERKKAVADRAFVCLEAAKTVTEPVRFEKGLKLSAGRDEKNKNIVFETEEEVTLSHARLVQAHTLFYDQTAGYYKGIFKDQVLNEEGFGRERYTGGDGQEAPYFETFGRSPLFKKKWDHVKGSPESAAFGFAITSNLLYLEEGTRTIDVTMNFTGNSAFSPVEINHLKKCLYLTTAEGWWKVPSGRVSTLTFTNNSCQITISLEATAPSISRFDDFVDTPALKLIVAPFENVNELNQLTLLQKLSAIQINPNTITIEVEVRDFKALSCYNELGELNLQQPFQPFGPDLQPGDMFIVGSAEVMQKPLTELTLQLEWLDQAGTEQLGKVNCTINRNDPVENLSFQDGNIRVQPNLTIRETWVDTLPSYDHRATWGFIEFNLTKPNGAGNQERTFTITEKDNDRTITIPEIRVQNYTAKNLRLTYKAKSENSSGMTFLHCYPFNTQKKVTDNSCKLVEDYRFSGQDFQRSRGVLLLGIQDLPPGPLNLYFELMGSSMRPLDSKSDSAKPIYYVLRDNLLKPLAVLRDSTEQLGQSGIVRLQIPDCKKDQPSSIMPEGCTWLAIVADDRPEYYGLTNGIYLHAVAARRKIDPTANPDPIGNKRIERTLNKEASIRRVVQPYASILLKHREGDAAFQQRVQRQLRTQQQYPFTKQDLEAMICEQYPEVYRCGVRTDNNGSIRITLLPYRKEAYLRPAFPLAFLKEVQKVVAAWLPVWCKVVVENPHYAEFQMQVKLKDDYSLEKELKIQQQIVTELDPWFRENDANNQGQISDSIQKAFFTKIANLFEFVSSCRLNYRYFNNQNASYVGYFEFRNVNAPKQAVDVNKHLVFIPDKNQDNHKAVTEFNNYFHGLGGANTPGRGHQRTFQ